MNTTVSEGRLDRQCRNKPRSEGVAAPRACPDPVDQPAECQAALPANSQFRAKLMRQGPLAGRYPAVAAMVTLALIPYLALSAAFDPLVPIISEQLHMSAQALSLSSGLGNAAYAVGTVLAVQFAQHLPQRRMMLLYAVLLVVGSVLSAAARPRSTTCWWPSPAERARRRTCRRSAPPPRAGTR